MAGPTAPTRHNIQAEVDLRRGRRRRAGRARGGAGVVRRIDAAGAVRLAPVAALWFLCTVALCEGFQRLRWAELTTAKDEEQ